MNKTAKTWLIVATSLILIGCIIFSGVMSVLKWDFSKLSTTKFQTNTYDITENYKNISIKSNTSDISFISTDSDKTTVVCNEEINLKHSVTVKDDTLLIEINDTRKWYQYIGVSFGKQNITVNLPKGEYGALSINTDTSDVEIASDFKFESVDISLSTGDVTNLASATDFIKIKTSTGNINTENITANNVHLTATTGKISAENLNSNGDIKLKVSTGKTNLSNIKCKNLISSGSTGDIYLSNVISTEKFDIKRSTGDVKLELCDAAELSITTDTGNVKGSLLSEKIFITQTDTGEIDVPKTLTGGKCEISTDTGDIIITIK
ncbi:MAG: DUF4097 family beta strand repeat protein [Clostridia bacterium]|nr:DUF4097 family beta strand repeat protein [Clostridia bacterium]